MRFRLFALSAMIAAFPGSAFADVGFAQVPTSWRLQNYTGPYGVAAYYTASNCTSGQLTFSSSATTDDRNRFWATVLTARALGLRVGIYYETATGFCNITSFYLAEQ